MKSSTSCSPSSMERSALLARRPAFSVRKSRSTVMTWETLATESLGRPDSEAGINHASIFGMFSHPDLI